MFVSTAFAQDIAASEPSALGGLVPILLMVAIFYFLILRPQQKKYKDHQAMVMSVKKGDKVQTSGGILGKVTKVDDKENIVHVTISDSVTVQVSRPTLVAVYGKDGQPNTASMQTHPKKEKQSSANDN